MAPSVTTSYIARTLVEPYDINRDECILVSMVCPILPKDSIVLTQLRGSRKSSARTWNCLERTSAQVEYIDLELIVFRCFGWTRFFRPKLNDLGSQFLVTDNQKDPSLQQLGKSIAIAWTEQSPCFDFCFAEQRVVWLARGE